MDASPFARVPGFRTPAPTPRHLITTETMLKAPASLATWTSSERLYLTAQGAVVAHGSPEAETLLVAAGGQIALADAIALGLTATPTPVVNAAPAIDVPNVPASGTVAVPDADSEARAVVNAARAKLGIGEDEDLLAAIDALLARQPATTEAQAALSFDVAGISGNARKALEAANLWSVEALRAATDAELQAVPNIGEGTIAAIRAAQAQPEVPTAATVAAQTA